MLAGELSNPGLLNFGAFETLPYSVFEIPIFVGMGQSPVSMPMPQSYSYPLG